MLAPEPAMAPGFMVHAPEGKPFSIMLPVETEQLGCVIVPMAGAGDVMGCILMTTLADAADIQPAALVTVKL